MRSLTHRRTYQGFFFQNQGNFSNFQNRAGETAPTPPASWAPGKFVTLLRLSKTTHISY